MIMGLEYLESMVRYLKILVVNTNLSALMNWLLNIRSDINYILHFFNTIFKSYSEKLFVGILDR